MARIIKTSSPGKDRNRLSKAIVIAIRAFMRKQEPDNSTNDIVAFIILALRDIADGIDKSVVAWEKRGYWVKADKFRLEWQWTDQYAIKLQYAFAAKDWGSIANLLIQVMSQFEKIKVSDRHRMGKPWIGAYGEYQKSLTDL